MILGREARYEHGTQRGGPDIKYAWGARVASSMQGKPAGGEGDENNDLANFSSLHSPKGATRNGWL